MKDVPLELLLESKPQKMHTSTHLHYLPHKVKPCAFKILFLQPKCWPHSAREV